MDANDELTRTFEANRDHLQGVARRMLGSTAEAEDAVQESWLRVSRAGTDDVENLRAWLTSITARICLDRLRSRRSRREDPIDDALARRASPAGGAGDPEHEAELADAVGPALLVVLEALSPAERLAFVLHDLFALPFDEVAPLVGRTPEAARQLASRARRRIQGVRPSGSVDRERQREVVEAFLDASRRGDFEGLLALLDPDVVLRVDPSVLPPGAAAIVRGAEAVGSRAYAFRARAEDSHVWLVDGLPGLVGIVDGRPTRVQRFTVVEGSITELEVLADPVLVAQLELVDLGG